MKRLLLLSLLVCGSACFGQTSTDGTNNTFVADIESVGGRTIQVFLTVSYADNIGDDQYIDVANFRADTPAIIATITNKNAPLEVFASNILNTLFAKYPQIQSLLVQISYQASTINQQTIQSQRTRKPAATQPPARNDR